MTAADFAALGIDAETILYVTTWGFGFVVGSYFLGWTVGLAVSLIRKA